MLRRPELTVLGVCVAACVRAVRVAPVVVVVVDLARKRSLVLFHAELMVRGGSAERETEDDRVLFTRKQKQKGPERNAVVDVETRDEKKKKTPTRPKCVSVYFQRSLKASRVIGTTVKLRQSVRQKLWPRVL